VRQEKQTGDWFLGSVTDENERAILINFDFLDANYDYDAIIYSDGVDAHWNDNPTSINIEKLSINRTMSKSFHLAPGGGLAISLKIRE
jgi:glucan 1,4-alpha-glucosidase